MPRVFNIMRPNLYIIARVTEKRLPRISSVASPAARAADFRVIQVFILEAFLEVSVSLFEVELDARAVIKGITIVRFTFRVIFEGDIALIIIGPDFKEIFIAFFPGKAYLDFIQSVSCLHRDGIAFRFAPIPVVAVIPVLFVSFSIIRPYVVPRIRIEIVNPYVICAAVPYNSIFRFRKLNICLS